MKRHKKASVISVFSLLIIALISFYLNYFNNNSTGENILSVHFIDVGQGDCTLIELPEDKVMLIDAGDNGKESIIFEYLEELGVEKIDYLIATHPHADHIGGMEEIMERYEIGEIYMPNAETASTTFENMLDVAESKNLSINSAYEGKNIFDYSGVKADIISPKKGESYSNLNNYSVAVKLVCGEKSFLFTGDAEKETENEILDDFEAIECDVLKVGHHGSSTSSEYEFLKAVNPQYAVISCGKDNEYGHPHRETLESLKKIKAEVLRTDELGTIVIETDGKKISIKK